MDDQSDREIFMDAWQKLPMEHRLNSSRNWCGFDGGICTLWQSLPKIIFLVLHGPYGRIRIAFSDIRNILISQELL